jgi:hypothetical protein
VKTKSAPPPHISPNCPLTNPSNSLRLLRSPLQPYVLKFTLPERTNFASLNPLVSFSFISVGV